MFDLKGIDYLIDGVVPEDIHSLRKIRKLIRMEERESIRVVSPALDLLFDNVKNTKKG